MKTLFHYTTAAGLLKILQSSSLWASDHRFLNDAQEALFARDLLVDAVRTMDNPVRSPDHWAHDLGEDAATTFANYQGFIVDELGSSGFGVYVACFCESGDLLSQWRGYGTDHGYSIEVTVDALEATLSGLSTYAPATGVAQVRYGTDAARDVVDAALRSVADFNLNHPGVKAHYKALELNSMLARIKHPGFAEEREWRLVAAFEIFDEPIGQVEDERTKFRSTPMAIVPYIELDLPLDAIVSIRVGPGTNVDVREAGVRRLLKALGSRAEVLQSDLPLRA
ncbi:MAG: DUF2971 domain-containing protein [Actinomycetota bacterium]|nr:DUF2971 domain-containing protein [Actinomycetota bacterium]